MTDDLLPAALAIDVEPLNLHELADLVDSPYDGNAEVPDKPRWQIDGLNTAEWALRKLAEYEAEGKRIDEQAEEWRARIDHWQQVERASKRIDRTVAFFSQHLANYALAEREADPKAKTLRLPSGEVKTTSSAAKVVVENEPEFLLWARKTLSDEQWEAVTTEPKVSLTGMRGLVELREVIDEASFVFSPCGCVANMNYTSRDDGPTLDDLGPVGTAGTCAMCTDEALVGQVAVTATHHEVRYGESIVPGLAAEEASVTAKVKANG